MHVRRNHCFGALLIGMSTAFSLATGELLPVHARDCTGPCFLRMRAVSAIAQAPHSVLRSQSAQVLERPLKVFSPLLRQVAVRGNRFASGPLQASVSMSAVVGWNGRYRVSGAWVPLRVTIHNRGSAVLDGVVSVATPSVLDPLQNRPGRDTTYESEVVLLGNATRRVTLDVPGRLVPDHLTVAFDVAHKAIATETLFPIPIDDQNITVGVLTNDDSAMTWVQKAKVAGGKTEAIRLTPSTLDPVPEILAGFDAIVVTNVNSALLDQSQLYALERYVRNGGTLVTVGGPDWQETLRPLPAVMIPGRLRGSTTVHTLLGLNFFASGVPPPSPAIVSVLAAPEGAAVGAPMGPPLVVRASLGVGHLEYLAFDPALSPISGWKAAPLLLTRLITGVTPEAMRRLSLPAGFNLLSFRDPGPGRLEMTRTAIPVPDLSVPVLPLTFPIFATLVVIYVFLLGPLCYLALRRSRRPNIGWLVAPVFGLTISGAIVGLAHREVHGGAVLGTVSALELDGASQTYPADSYVRVYALRAGDHTLVLPSPALAAAVPTDQTTGSGVDLGTQWLLRQGVQTSATLSSLSAGGSRIVNFHDEVHVRGHLTEHLHVDRHGYIVGSIENGTALSLVHPVVVAGQTFSRLPALAPGARVDIHVRPRVNVLDHRYRPMLNDIYGNIGGSDGGQLRNAVMMLPETSALSMLGEVQFLAWTRKSLISVTVDGVEPRRSDLTLVVKPLSVGLGAGNLDLQPGTIGAHPMDEVPVTPRYACCNPSVEGIFIGGGGAATFEFDVPAPGRVHARSLALSVFAGGPDTTYTGYNDMPAHSASVYNWETGQWTDLRFVHGTAQLPRPQAMISQSGALLVRIRASQRTGDLAIFDPYHDLQISGHVAVR
ncbi:MAG: hypothetical protein NVS4B2_23700 [Chloroflexota bacterium]